MIGAADTSGNRCQTNIIIKDNRKAKKIQFRTGAIEADNCSRPRVCKVDVSCVERPRHTHTMKPT